MRKLPEGIFEALIRLTHPFSTFYEVASHCSRLEGQLTGNGTGIAVYSVSNFINSSRGARVGGGQRKSWNRGFQDNRNQGPRDPGFKRPQKSETTCWVCREKGHISRNCPKMEKGNIDPKVGFNKNSMDKNTLNFSEKTANQMLKVLKRAGGANAAEMEEETVLINLVFDNEKPHLNIVGPSGKSTKGIIDSGAMRTCISLRDMNQLGLVKTSRTLKVKGVTGVTRAFYVRKARVTINGVELELNAITIDDDSVPTLVGQPELRVLGEHGYVLKLSDMCIGKCTMDNVIKRTQKDGENFAHSKNDPIEISVRTLAVNGDKDNLSSLIPDLMCLTECEVDELYGKWNDDILVYHIEEYTVQKEKLNAIRDEYNNIEMDNYSPDFNSSPSCIPSGVDIIDIEGNCNLENGEIHEPNIINLGDEQHKDAVEEAFQMLRNKMTTVELKNTVSGVSSGEKDKILEDKIKHLGDNVKTEVRDLFTKYKDVWREPQTGKMESKAHFTVTGQPIVMKQRPMTESMVVEYKKQVDELLEKGVIQPSKSAWGSVPVFVKKPDGSWRLCFDYRRLNKKMVFDAYPIPRIWDLVKSLVGYKVYSILDANWGFWNLKLSDESKPYTAFITPWGLFEWTVLPFGVKNSPGEFQRAMDFALRDIKDFINVYIDDMFFGSMEIKEHLIQLERLLNACRIGGVYLKIAKADLVKSEIKVLGHIVNHRGVTPDPKKIKTIKNTVAPTNVKEIRAFVGAVQFLARFFNMGEYLAPLTELTKKYSRFEWTALHQECFDNIKNMLTEHMLLGKFDESKPVGLVCDACDNSIGSCLFQMEGENMIPLEFYSKKFSVAEKKYHVREKEFLAIKYSLTHFNDICKATHTYVFTDHQSLEWLADSSVGRIQRWSLFLQQYNYTMLYLPGRCNVIADWLSRTPIDDSGDVDMEIEKISCPKEITCFSLENIPELDKIEESIKEGWWKNTELEPTAVPDIQMFKNEYVKDNESGIIPVGVTECSDGLYRYRDRKGGEITKVIYVPKSLRPHVLNWFHASLEGGHQGVNRTNKRMRKCVGWPGMMKDLRAFVASCPCRRILKLPNQLFRSVRGILECPRPFEVVSIDFIGPKTWNQKQWYVAVIVDHATRYMFNVVSNTCTTSDSKRAMNEWCGIFGAPQAILHDGGPEFTGSEFKLFVLCRLRVRFIRCSTAYPQGNAINESSHQVVNNMITAQAICAQSEPFPEVIRAVTMCYNATPHPNLGASPYYCMFGTEMMFPGWQKLSVQLAQQDRFRNLLRVRLEALMRSRVRELESIKVPEGDNVHDIKVGDWVWYKLSEYEKDSHYGSANITLTKKLQPRWSWPCKVKEVRKKQLLIQSLGNPAEPPRLVPLMHTRLIPTNIPKSMAALHLKSIDIEAPRIPPSHRKLVNSGDVSMDKLMEIARNRREKSKSPEGINMMLMNCLDSSYDNEFWCEECGANVCVELI